jgi:hypothetical protein
MKERERNAEILGYCLMAVALILPAVVGLTVAAKGQSPGSAFLRAVLVTPLLGAALGYGVGYLHYSVYPPNNLSGWGWFPSIWDYALVGAFFMGGAALAVGLLGGGLIAWLKVARRGR